MDLRAIWRRLRGKAAREAMPHALPAYLAGRLGTRVGSFVPLDGKASVRLYRDMRGAFPVLDVAITKLARLCGRVEITAPERVKEELLAWMERVQVNALQRGLDAWLTGHLDTMMTCGRAVGEIVPDRARSEVFALTNLDPATVELRTVPAQPLSLEVVQWQGAGWVAIPPPYVLVSLHNPQSGSPHGVSLYRSLPLVAEALSVIENATVQVWQRMGAPPYHVNWKPGEGFQDPDGTLTQAAVARMQEEFTAAMEARAQGEVRDFFSAGEVSVDVIGNKNALFDIQSPFRAFAEQVIAATGLPSWMFGFNWSSTETLSVQQADMIVANVEAIRRAVQPAVEQILDLRQRLRGKPPVKVSWSAVNLRDLTEEARGRNWREMAQARRIENGRRMWELGYWNQEQAARYADPELVRVAREYVAPPASAERLSAGLHPERSAE